MGVNKFLHIFPYILVFFAALYFPQDPDLGWHLKYGEYFIKNGHLLNENTFTHLMPGFEWINTSWGIDVLDYLIFTQFGFLGLMIAGASVITATFFFFSRTFKLNTLEQVFIFPFLLFLEHTLINQSFKGQSVSILFLSIQIYLLEKYFTRDYKKLTTLLFLLYILWANINAQFILGLIILGLYLGSKTIINGSGQQLKRWRSVVIIFLIIISATLLNPFGVGLFVESFNVASNSKIKLIQEYQPISSVPTLFLGFILTTFILIFSYAIIYTEKASRKYSPYLIILGVLYVAAIFTSRIAFSLFYFTIPFLKLIVSSYLTPKKVNNRILIVVTILIIQTVLLLYMKNPTSLLTNLTWSKYCKHFISCSPQAGNFLIEHNLDSKKVFSIYNWGGYLIWNYPQISPPIDGRMLLWEDKNGFSGFDYYYSIIQNNTDIDATDYQVALIDKSILSERLFELEKEGKWRLMYEDKKSYIFVRNEE